MIACNSGYTLDGGVCEENCDNNGADETCMSGDASWTPPNSSSNSNYCSDNAEKCYPCADSHSLSGGECVADCSSDNCGACNEDRCGGLTSYCDWTGSSCTDRSNECTLNDYRWPAEGDWCCIDPNGNGVSTERDSPLSDHITYY